MLFVEADQYCSTTDVTRTNVTQNNEMSQQKT